MYWLLAILLYILIGVYVFIWIARDDISSDSWVLFTLAAPVIILSYPYFLLRRYLKK
nr:hypothetical protein [Metabacillus halosaccharovorans]